MAQMQAQMANMPPDMMQQAMSMANNATPEQLRQMKAATANMSAEDIAAQSARAAAQMRAGVMPPGAGAYAGTGGSASSSGGPTDLAAGMKAEGNRLHSARRFQEAAAQYERAIASLAGGLERVGVGEGRRG